MHAQVTPEDSRLLHSIPPARVALIERIAQAARGAGKSATAQGSLQQRFVRSYFRGVGEEDLRERTPAALARVAMDHLAFAMERKPAHQTLIRVFNPDPKSDGFDSAHTVVMIVTEVATISEGRLP